MNADGPVHLNETITRAKFEELVKFEKDIKNAQQKKEESSSNILQKQKEIESETQENAYIENNIAKIHQFHHQNM